MPFGLKNAPSQFQKAMVALFQPLLTNALIYTNDILLFSKDAESHERLLTKFYNLMKSHRIMLSEKTMVKWKIHFATAHCCHSWRISK